MGRLNGKVAVVTGGSQGIGAAYCKRLAEEGAKIIVADISSGESIVNFIKEMGGEAKYVKTNVVLQEDNERMVEEATKTFGGLDILVSNAGLYTNLERKISTDETPDEWDQVMEVNIKGVWLSSKAAIPTMKQKGYGKIINIASTAAFSGQGHSTRYAASKAAVLGITRTMAREFGPDGIRINAIAPGPIQTDTPTLVDGGDLEKRQNAILQRRAIKRIGVPEDVVGLCVFLASPGSDFMTGQTVVVDGGTIFW